MPTNLGIGFSSPGPLAPLSEEPTGVLGSFGRSLAAWRAPGGTFQDFLNPGPSEAKQHYDQQTQIINSVWDKAGPHIQAMMNAYDGGSIKEANALGNELMQYFSAQGMDPTKTIGPLIEGAQRASMAAHGGTDAADPNTLNSMLSYPMTPEQRLSTSGTASGNTMRGFQGEAAQAAAEANRAQAAKTTATTEPEVQRILGGAAQSNATAASTTALLPGQLDIQSAQQRNLGSATDFNTARTQEQNLSNTVLENTGMLPGHTGEAGKNARYVKVPMGTDPTTGQERFGYKPVDEVAGSVLTATGDPIKNEERKALEKSQGAPAAPTSPAGGSMPAHPGAAPSQIPMKTIDMPTAGGPPKTLQIPEPPPGDQTGTSLTKHYTDLGYPPSAVKNIVDYLIQENFQLRSRRQQQRQK